MANLINTLNGLVWATPLILLTFGGAVLYSIVLKFCNIINSNFAPCFGVKISPKPV